MSNEKVTEVVFTNEILEEELITIRAENGIKYIKAKEFAEAMAEMSGGGPVGEAKYMHNIRADLSDTTQTYTLIFQMISTQAEPVTTTQEIVDMFQSYGMIDMQDFIPATGFWYLTASSATKCPIIGISTTTNAQSTSLSVSMLKADFSEDRKSVSLKTATVKTLKDCVVAL